MTLRSSWKGFIRLSLISVPVKAYPASASAATIRLNQLHEECHSPIKHKKVCPIHGEVTSDAIVSGYEYAKGQYVEIDPEELAKLRTKGEKAITIDGFLRPEKLEAIYLGPKTYYLAPDGPLGERPYRLLQKVMAEEGLYALAQVVLSQKERLVVVRPYGHLLTITTLYLKHEVRALECFDEQVVVDATCSADELSLIREIIASRTAEDFDFGKYKDAYQEKLTELIEAKVEGREIFSAPTEEEPQILNLMDALKKSVAVAEKKSAAESRRTRSGRAPKAKAPRERRQASGRRKKAS